MEGLAKWNVIGAQSGDRSDARSGNRESARCGFDPNDRYRGGPARKRTVAKPPNAAIGRRVVSLPPL
jgi:hypothetical protein